MQKEEEVEFQQNVQKSKLLNLNNLLDVEDELEKSWSLNYEKIKEKIENLTETESTNKLLEFVNDVSNHFICTTGLLYGYLISENSNPPVRKIKF
jgi:hypothetical protein